MLNRTVGVFLLSLSLCGIAMAEPDQGESSSSECGSTVAVQGTRAVRFTGIYLLNPDLAAPRENAVRPTAAGVSPQSGSQQIFNIPGRIPLVR